VLRAEHGTRNTENEHTFNMAKPSPLHFKRAVVARARELMAAGASLHAVAIELRMPKGTLHKWLAAPQLEPNYAACGRPKKFDLTAEERRALRGLVLKHGSFAFAVEVFAGDVACEPGTRAAIGEELDKAVREKRMARWPVSLRAGVMSSVEEEALFRGNKAFDAVSHSPRKGMFFEDHEGRQVPIGALDVWMMDDYSTNQPYMVDTAEGARLCRQTLAAMDLYSAGWLSVEMIGRERDAYRAEDILRFILRTIEAQGTMPLCLMLERGRWESQAVHGIPLDELGRGFAGQVWGELDALFHIEHGYSSRHKAQLESSFNLLQTVLAHSGRDIGRFRGEFERATNLSLGVRAGRVDAEAAHFLSQDASRDAHWKAMQTMNSRQRERSAAIFEGQALVPNDLLMSGDRQVRPLPAEEAWRFLPVKRLATVRKGGVEVEVTHYRGASFRFEVNGVSDLYVESGHRVLIAFDPAAPALGCHVANAVPNCREGWAVGAKICTARHWEDVAQFSLRSRTAGHERSSKGIASAAARTAFAGINPHRQGMTHTQAHNGGGEVKIKRTGRPMTNTAAGDGAETARGVVRHGGGNAEMLKTETLKAETLKREEGLKAESRGPKAEAVAAARRAALMEAEALLES
jgi:hypothetical protein